MKSIFAGNISGTLTAPPSKSMFIRAIAAASLVKGTSTINAWPLCDDMHAAIKVASGLGTLIELNDAVVVLRGNSKERSGKLNCGESALCLRLFSSLAALEPTESSLLGSGSLKNRPVNMIVKPLRDLGVVCTVNSGGILLTVKGPLNSGTINIDAQLSSQFLSGFSLPCPPLKKVLRFMYLN